MALKPKSIHFHDYRIADRQHIQAFKKEIEDLIDQDFAIRINVKAYKCRNLLSATSSSSWPEIVPGTGPDMVPGTSYYTPNIIASSPHEDFTVSSRIRKGGNCKDLKNTDSSVLDYHLFRDAAV